MKKPCAKIGFRAREVLSLYEISKTLGSTLKLSEVLPIVAANSRSCELHSLVIYLQREPGSCRGGGLVIGKTPKR